MFPGLCVSPFQISISWPAEFELGCNLKGSDMSQMGHSYSAQLLHKCLGKVEIEMLSTQQAS